MDPIRIDLRNGKGTVLLDHEDADFVQRRWHRDSDGYARRNIHPSHTGKWGVEILHRLVMERMEGTIPRGFFTDHINGNRLDNRRSNLRLATPSQNGANRKVNDGMDFKGIAWDGRRCRWKAIVRVMESSRSAGSYTTREDAARAYDRLARSVYGSFARLNFPEESCG